jgi:uncharacterized protein YkwD
MAEMVPKHDLLRPVSVIGLACVIVAVCLSCQGPPTRLLPGATHSKPEVRLERLEQQVHSLVNAERKKHGLSPLSWNDALNHIARKHSQDMAKQGYFSHNSPEGHDFSYRYRQQGYQCVVQGQGNAYYTGGENIFQNNLYDRVMIMNGVKHYEWNSSEKIAETTVDGWMKSPGHRKNILMPYWVSEGVGVSVSPDEKVYITQNFC